MSETQTKSSLVSATMRIEHATSMTAQSSLQFAKVLSTFSQDFCTQFQSSLAQLRFNILKYLSNISDTKMEDPTTNQSNEEVRNEPVKMQTSEVQQNLIGESAPAMIDQEVVELVKTRVDSYDIDIAMKELNDMINHLSEMYHQLKKVKYNYLVQTCELFSRIDYPSIMLERCRQELGQVIPKPKDINGLSM